ncbi:hypothetical protein ACHAXR_011489 [Thalassiosira sp. AJA248-18]
MNPFSMEKSMVGMPIQLNNYDVLLMPSCNHEPLRFAPGNYVGNKRFQVLLSLFRQKYLQADLFGDEYQCASIAQDLLKTVCDKCVPNGRFFVQGRNNRWQLLERDSPSTIGMIENALKNDPVESPSSERSPKRVCRRSEGFETLCKTALSALAALADEFVESPNPFDVVCEASGLGISPDPKYTGNNRLKVIFDIRKRSYENSDQEGKQRIAREVVSSILDDASHHFLQVDTLSGMYKLIASRELATACIKNALDVSSEVETKQLRESEVKNLIQRKQKKAIWDRLKGGSRSGVGSSSNLVQWKQKKAILARLKGGSRDYAGLSSNNPPPTKFTTSLRANIQVPRAA